MKMKQYVVSYINSFENSLTSEQVTAESVEKARTLHSECVKCDKDNDLYKVTQKMSKEQFDDYLINADTFISVIEIKSPIQ